MIENLYAKSLYIRQRSSIDFAPDPSEVTKGLDRQISEPIQGERRLRNIFLLYWSSGKRVDYQSLPQDKIKAESETKPTEIDGKIKSNGVEAKSIEAKPENTDVKNCSVNDTSPASEAKPAADESAVPSQPEPGHSREIQPQPNAEKVQQAKERNETGKEQAKDKNEIGKEQTKDRNEPAKVEKVEVAKDRNESAKVEKEAAEEQAKPRIEGGEGQAKTSAEAGKVEKSVLVTRPTRRVPPGGHCSQLW